MTRRRITPRKLLVASVGVATLNYLGVAPAACGGTTIEEGDGGSSGAGAVPGGGTAGAGGGPRGTGGFPTVANLMAPPGTGGTPPPFPTVANLMPPPGTGGTPPPFPTVANLMPPPFPTVANLMAPPPPIKDASVDAEKPDTGPAKDAASD